LYNNALLSNKLNIFNSQIDAISFSLPAASLRKILSTVTDAKTEEARKVHFSAVQELMTNAQWANDEGDFGESY